MEPLIVTDRLTRYWHRFADHSLTGYAPIYEQMVRFWADDAEVMALVAEAPTNAHGPNSLQAATHYLLLEDSVAADHPLGKIYAGESDEHPGPSARELVLGNRDEVAKLLATRTVQTNEVARSGAIAAGLGHIGQATGMPLALADIGCSAGLNLLFDRYRLDYHHSHSDSLAHSLAHSLGAAESSGASIGPHDAEVIIPVAWSGAPIPPQPEIVWRHGYDRNPIDLSDVDAARWLEALVWPDHPERMQRLRAAVREALLHPPAITKAEALDVLDAALVDAPAKALLTVVTSWVYFYFDEELRKAFDRRITEADRPVAWLSLELAGIVAGVEVPDQPKVEGEFSLISAVIGGTGSTPARTPLGWAHPHGISIHWLGG